eukprot:scaffold840_cov344-Pavlova_lutheri.AAC.127
MRQTLLAVACMAMAGLAFLQTCRVRGGRRTYERTQDGSGSSILPTKGNQEKHTFPRRRTRATGTRPRSEADPCRIDAMASSMQSTASRHIPPLRRTDPHPKSTLGNAGDGGEASGTRGPQTEATQARIPAEDGGKEKSNNRSRIPVRGDHQRLPATRTVQLPAQDRAQAGERPRTGPIQPCRRAGRRAR